MTSNVGSTPMRVATLTTAEKQSFCFGAPARAVPGRKFHYNTALAICQVENAK